jgi:hypothetical protein
MHENRRTAPEAVAEKTPGCSGDHWTDVTYWNEDAGKVSKGCTASFSLEAPAPADKLYQAQSKHEHHHHQREALTNRDRRKQIEKQRHNTHRGAASLCTCTCHSLTVQSTDEDNNKCLKVGSVDGLMLREVIMPKCAPVCTAITK